ncbi:TetR/AcrR family transcriptional regulator, partial [Acinetobacter baumannii]
NRRRPKHDPKESEREILNAAEKFLSERPFRELNVDEVMKLTGLKRPAFYVHFRDKYDLALRVVQDIGQELFTLANHWLKGNNFPEDS